MIKNKKQISSRGHGNETPMESDTTCRLIQSHRLRKRNGLRNLLTINRNFFLLIALLLFTLHVTRYTLYARKIHPDAGTTAATFLKIGVGARPSGMGEAFLAVADDVNAVYWNPAGLAFLKRQEVTAMHSEWFQDIRYDFAAYARPLQNYTLGGSLTGLFIKKELERRSGGAGENDPFNPITNAEGTFGAYDLNVSFSYARKLNRQWGLGTNFKIIHQVIDDEDELGAGLDLGLLYKSADNSLNMGFMIQNFGPGMKFVERTYNLPLTFKLGAGYKIGNGIFAIEVNKPIDNYLRVHLGGEYWFWRRVALRFGYKIGIYESLQDNLFGPSVGAGFKIGDYQMDYALMPHTVLGNTHRISFTARFGKEVKEQRRRIVVQKDTKETGYKENARISWKLLKASPYEMLWEMEAKTEASVLSLVRFRSRLRNPEIFKLEVSDSTNPVHGATVGEEVFRKVTIKHNLNETTMRDIRLQFRLPGKEFNQGVSLYQFQEGEWKRLNWAKTEEKDGWILCHIQVETLSPFLLTLKPHQ